MIARPASHSRVADSTRVSSTICKSKVERLMTFSTSAVAVCCWWAAFSLSSASASSRASLEISFLTSTPAGARLRVVGALQAATGLRTVFPRFAIEVSSGPGKLQIIKAKYQRQAYPIERQPYSQQTSANDHSIARRCAAEALQQWQEQAPWRSS